MQHSEGMLSRGTDTDTRSLEQILGHVFREPALLNEAMTHPSCNAGYSNQRLEFLGDAVIGLVVGRRLFERFPEEPEGQLSRRKAALVQTRSLAQLAEQLHLGDYLRVGEGEENVGGRKKQHILEDAMEALIGAVYLDAGYDAAEKLLLPMIDPLIDELPSLQSLVDAKTILQEKVQEVPNHTVRYRTVRMEGPPHCPEFTVELLIDGGTVCEGTGPSRKKAEQQAAALALSEFSTLVSPRLRGDG